MDIGHDYVELLIHFFGRPLEVHGVLAHFETRGGYAACVDSLARSVHCAAFDESVDSFGSTAHV